MDSYPQDWSKYKVGQIGKVVTGKTPSKDFPEQWGDQYLFITPTDMNGQRDAYSTARSLSAEGAKALRRLRIPAGSVCVSCIGWQMGKSIIAIEPSFTNQQLNTIIPNFDLVDTHFLYYTFSNRRSELFRLASGGSRTPILRKSMFEELELVLPPLDEQRAIAHILGSLDDKIEANRRMNATLEATARAIFKSWFVDFDPVHAKANGQAPSGMDAATAALFPDSFEDSELGLVPSGWGVGTIGDAVKAVGGSTPSTAEPTFWDDGTINWATPKDLSGLSSPVLLDTDRRITELGLQQISSGLLPKGTLLLSSRAPVGYLAVAEIPVAINQGFIAMICDEYFPSLYALFWTESNLDVIKNRASGTTFQEISKRNFRPILALIPSSDVLRSFVEIVEPLYRQIVRNLEECRTLAETRDALLPRLVSGEIRVPHP